MPNHSLNTYDPSCLTCRCLLLLFRSHGHYPQKEVDTETLHRTLSEPLETYDG